MEITIQLLVFIIIWVIAAIIGVLAFIIERESRGPRLLSTPNPGYGTGLEWEPNGEGQNEEAPRSPLSVVIDYFGDDERDSSNNNNSSLTSPPRRRSRRRRPKITSGRRA
ncbi:hypothetical protein GGR53DRAFT_469273 [Hypoxylon sp. FL1150]|nr:hypothetical protein GGR53DRAFT_469273 [Hypoxylon sp. FL1150]